MKIRLPLAVLSGLLSCLAIPAHGQTPPLTAYTGNIQVTFWISLTTPLLQGESINCLVSATVSENDTAVTPPYTNTIVEYGTVPGTVSSTSAFCIVNIPYEWYLATQASDNIAISYTISYVLSSATTGTFFALRSTSSSLGSVPVPATNGSVVVGPRTIRL
jgi:hypothetical protein